MAKKAPSIAFPAWLTTPDGDLAGNLLTGNYLIDQMGIDPLNLKYEEWGQLWDAMYQFRKLAPKLTPLEFHKIAHNDYTPPKTAVDEYQRLSNVLDNLFSLYGDPDGKGPGGKGTKKD